MPAGSVPAALEIGEDLVGIAEGEVMKHHHDVLHIGAGLGRIADDQRGGHQPLLLQAVMGMHPVGAGAVERKVVVIAGAGLERRLRQVRYAVLLPGRRQAVPVDQGLLVDVTFQPHPEALAGFGRQAVAAIGLGQPEDGGGAAVHLDDTGADADRRGRCRKGRFAGDEQAGSQADQAGGGGGCQELATTQVLHDESSPET
jgi:hypothetical protein